MNLWSAIQYVTSGLGLAAFAIAVGLLAYQTRLSSREKLIKSVSPKDRPKIIADTAEFFHVDISGLTLEQQEKVVQEQVKYRWRRNLLAAICLIVLALILAYVVVTIVAKRDPAPQFGEAIPTFSDVSCRREGSLKSTEFQRSAIAIFRNNHGAPVRLDWINYLGDRVFYTTIGNGETYQQPTFIGHPWVVADASDTCLSIFVPTQATNEFIIK
jgi:hypothetical protein